MSPFDISISGTTQLTFSDDKGRSSVWFDVCLLTWAKYLSKLKGHTGELRMNNSSIHFVTHALLTLWRTSMWVDGGPIFGAHVLKNVADNGKNILDDCCSSIHSFARGKGPRRLKTPPPKSPGRKWTTSFCTWLKTELTTRGQLSSVDLHRGQY